MTVGHCEWKDRGVIVEFSTLPSRARSWRTRRAGTATAAPTPAPTAGRAPRESWPAPSTPTSAAGERNFLQGKGDLHGDQDPLSATHPANSGCSGSPGTSVTGCNDYEEDSGLLDMRPHLLGMAAQGAQLLLREVPRATSPLRLQEAQQVEVGRESLGPEVVRSALSLVPRQGTS